MSDTEITPIKAPTQVRDFDDDTATPTSGLDKPTESPRFARLAETRGANALVVSIDTARLYDAPVGDSSNIVRALELLKQASDHFSAARKADNPIDADRFLQRVQAILPKLFALRSIGDGFGVVVNSLYVAFANLRGRPMNHAQIDVAWRLVRELRARPALSLEQGIQLVEELEECGLVVDPPELAALLDDSELAEND